MNHLIVASQTVYALDVEQIVLFQSPDQLLVLWPFKVLAGLLVDIDVLLRDRQPFHSDKLSVLVLVFRADPHISIDIRDGSPP